MRLWLINKNTEAANAVLADSAALMSWFSETERQRYQQTSHQRKQAEFLLGRYLLRQALSEQFGPEMGAWCIEERHSKPPLIRDLPEGWHFSVSHSHALIGVTLAPYRHGLDLEYQHVQRRFEALAELVCDEAELTYIKQNSACQATAFYRVWCAKEALFKALGDDQVGVRLSELSYFALRDVASPWHLYETEWQGYQVTIVGEQSIEQLSIV